MSEEMQKTGGEIIQPLTRTRKRRLNDATIDQMAKLVAGQLSEAEAATLLGIKPATWYSFKSRCKREGKFKDRLLSYDAEFNQQCLQSIYKAGEDYEMQVGEKKVITKKGDWRAKAWLLATKHPKRFSDAASRVTIETPPAPPLNLTLIMTTLQRVYAEHDAKRSIVDVPGEPVKQLPAATDSEAAPVIEQGEGKP